MEGYLRRWLELHNRSVTHALGPRLNIGRPESHRIRGDIGDARGDIGDAPERVRCCEPAIVAMKVDDDIEDLLGRAMDLSLI